MRRIDKKLNMMKANLLAEQRYLQSKGLVNEGHFADFMPKGTKIKFNGRNAKIIAFEANPHQEVSYTIKYDDNGEQDQITGGDKRIEVNEFIAPLSDGSTMFSEEEGEKTQIKKINGKGTTIVGEPGYTPDGGNQLEEGLVKNIGMGLIAICTFASCQKVGPDSITYKYVYDTEQSLAEAEKMDVEVRSTCLAPSAKPLENDINEYNKVLTELREKCKKNGDFPIGDTIIRLENNTVKSPFMKKDQYGNVVVDHDKVKKALNGAK